MTMPRGVGVVSSRSRLARPSWARRGFALCAAALLVVYPGQSLAGNPFVLNGGDLVVARSRGTSPGVVKVDPITTAEVTLFEGPPLVAPEAVVIDANRDVIVADREANGGRGAIIRISHDTGDAHVFSYDQFFDEPIGLTIDPSDGRFLVAESQGQGSQGGLPVILRVNPDDGGQVRVVDGEALYGLQDVAVGADGKTYALTMSGSGRRSASVFRFDPPSSLVLVARRTIGLIARSRSLTATPDGRLLMGAGSAIVAIDPSIDDPESNQTVVATGFSEVQGIVVASSNTLFVIDSEQCGGLPGQAEGGIFRIEGWQQGAGASQVTPLLCPATNPRLRQPFGLAIVPQAEPPPSESECGNGRTDAGEACDGQACCAPDCTTLKSSSEICGTETRECHEQHQCNGRSPLCPIDEERLASVDSVCSDDNECTDVDTCDSVGNCRPGNLVCGASVREVARKRRGAKKRAAAVRIEVVCQSKEESTCDAAVRVATTTSATRSAERSPSCDRVPPPRADEDITGVVARKRPRCSGSDPLPCRTVLRLQLNERGRALLRCQGLGVDVMPMLRQGGIVRHVASQTLALLRRAR